MSEDNNKSITRETYLSDVQAAMEGILRVLPKSNSQLCPCVVQVKRAAATIRRAKVSPETKCDDDAWEGVRLTLSGCMPRTAMHEGMGRAEERAVAWRIAAAVGNAQDVVHRMVTQYGRMAKPKRMRKHTRMKNEWNDECEIRRREAEERENERCEQREKKRAAQREEEERRAMQKLMREGWERRHKRKLKRASRNWGSLK